MTYPKKLIMALMLAVTVASPGFSQHQDPKGESQDPFPMKLDGDDFEYVLGKKINGTVGCLNRFERGGRQIAIFGVRMFTGAETYYPVFIMYKGDSGLWYRLALYTQVIDPFSCVDDGESIKITSLGKKYFQLFWEAVPGYKANLKGNR